MPYQKKARSASPEEIKRNGHVSVFLQRMMKQYPQLSVPEFNTRLLSKPRTDTKVYGWLNARGCPNQISAQLLARAFSVPAQFFAPRQLDDDSEIVIPEGHIPEKLLAKIEPAKTTAKQRQEVMALLPAPAIPLAAPGFTSELSCKTNGDGTVYIHYAGTVTRERAVEIMAVLVK